MIMSGLMNKIIAFSLLFVITSNLDAETTIPLTINNGKIYKKVKTWKEIRDENIVKQQYDYSCGSGALATLMKIGFGEDIAEEDIIKLILKDKNQGEIQDIIKNGYSLLDLKKVAEKKGYFGEMYRLKLSHLYQLRGPVLIYFEPHGDKHFAVLKSVQGDRVFIADPARGNVRMSIYRFQKEWPGIILAIDKK